MEKLKRRKTHALLIQSVLLAGVSPALLVHPAVAQSSGSAIRTLLDRAKYLEDHGHPDIAAQASPRRICSWAGPRMRTATWIA
jgi:hypothetical protein